MPITRTPIIDDSGSGKDGTVIDNAWKQEFYGQIDAALAAGGPTYGTFTHTDASGQGLVITGSGSYTKIGKMVWFTLDVGMPTTGNTTPIKIGGLPFLCGPLNGGAFPVYGVTRTWLVHANQQAFSPYNPADSAPYTWANLSATYYQLTGQYQTP
jgi:hypothetical protein